MLVLAQAAVCPALVSSPHLSLSGLCTCGFVEREKGKVGVFYIADASHSKIHLESFDMNTP